MTIFTHTRVLLLFNVVTFFSILATYHQARINQKVMLENQDNILKNRAVFEAYVTEQEKKK